MDALKSLKVKTGTCRRIFKEVEMYTDEVVSEQAKTDKMKASGADKYDIKQQVRMVFNFAWMYELRVQCFQLQCESQLPFEF